MNTSLVSGLNGPWAIAVSGTNLFVANAGSNTVGEYNAITGATVNASFISAGNFPSGIAISGSNLFVADYYGGTIGEYNTATGSAVNASLISGLTHPCAIAVSGTDLFFTNETSDTISEYTTAGTVVNATLVAGLGYPDGITVSGSDLYVTNYDSGTIGEYNDITGDAVNASLVSGLDYPAGIAVSGPNLLVVNFYGSSVGEYNATTGAVVSPSLVPDLYYPEGIAISRPVPEPATLTLLVSALLGLGVVYLRRRKVRTIVQLLVAVALLASAVPAQADVFNMGGTISGGTWTGLASLSFVTVGNPGNVADPTTGHGSVPYTYEFGKYDVTVAQYSQFLNAVAASDPYGVYNPLSASTIIRSGSPGSYNYAVVPATANYPAIVNWAGDCRASATGCRTDSRPRRRETALRSPVHTRSPAPQLISR